MTAEQESPWATSLEDAELSSGSTSFADEASTHAPEPERRNFVASVLPPPFGWTDGLTETDGPRMWDKLLEVEQAKSARHRRTATIVLVEVLALEDAEERWGSGLALQLFVQLARELGRGVRKSDHIARIGPARFGVLLTETDEISAINFVDRIKSRCCGKFDPAANGFRLVMGWASPPIGGRLADAIVVAEERLAEALRRES